jgi:hypothetical protein
MLLAGQFAAFGVTPLCAGANSPGAGSREAPAHSAHATNGTHTPCLPAHQGSAPEHSPVGCLAMTGCAVAGIAALDAPQLIAPECTAERATPEFALLVSVSTTPETPPPIA